MEPHAVSVTLYVARASDDMSLVTPLSKVTRSVRADEVATLSGVSAASSSGAVRRDLPKKEGGAFDGPEACFAAAHIEVD